MRFLVMTAVSTGKTLHISVNRTHQVLETHAINNRKTPIVIRCERETKTKNTNKNRLDDIKEAAEE